MSQEHALARGGTVKPMRIYKGAVCITKKNKPTKIKSEELAIECIVDLADDYSNLHNDR